MASIQVIQGPDKGRKFELLAAENLIGRQSRSVELSDETVSRVHSRLLQEGNHWILSDYGSANGTFLNGVKITHSVRVKRGDQIRCGSTLLVFEGGTQGQLQGGGVDIDEDGLLIDASIVATLPSNEDSVIIPTPEAGAQAIGNLRILYNLIADISSIFDVELLLEHTLERVFDLLQADRGYVMLANDEGRLELKASLSRQVQDGSQDNPPISRTIINEVVRKRVGVLSANAMGDKRFAAGKSVHNYGIRSAICVPIMGREEVLGVLYVDSSVSQHTYSTEQLRLLTAIGFQAGLGIENVKLAQAKIQSERLAAVGETVAFLSHHIKNILQALGAGIDVVEMGINSGNITKAQTAWPIVQRSIDRINRLILNMLAFSKNREPLLENVKMKDILMDCVELVARHADERGIAIMCDIDEMPRIAADANGLHQAYLNLITNAMDAVEDGEGIVTIKAYFDSMHRQVVIQIIDNGSGIEAEQLENIFTPFFSSKGQKGTGLGLAVAKKVVEEHQGQIMCASQPDEGTIFTIHLPAMRKDDTRAGDLS